jgi:DNA-directed RNA polymerase subunit N (RpoN/RPB10)
MRINCLSCGHGVDLDDAYEDYEGKIKCFACGAVLEIRAQEGKLKSVESTTLGQPGSAKRASQPTR